jgi:hypothetical protein
MKSKATLLTLLTALLVVATAHAQERSFLFTMISPGVGGTSSFVHYDAAYGRQTFEPFGADGLEQNLGLQAALGRSFTLTAHMGLAVGEGPAATSQQAELIGHILKGDRLVDLSAGLGYRHEYAGTNVLLSRFIVGRRFGASELFGNLLVEKAFAANRDPFDLTTTIGYSHSFSQAIRVGVEAVGQDLEGFWNPEETEGGAVIYAGPTAGILFPGSNLNMVLGGGLILRATHSPLNSGAYRDLSSGQGNGFIVRTMLCYAF